MVKSTYNHDKKVDMDYVEQSFESVTPCQNYHVPWSGAPIVFLKSWQELPSFLTHIQKNTNELEELQTRLIKWNKLMKKRTILQIEQILLQQIYNTKAK